MKNIALLVTCMYIVGCYSRAEPGVIGHIRNKLGDSLHGSGISYSSELYLGRLSHGAKLELLDAEPRKDEYDQLIIKVKVINDDEIMGDWTDYVGWVNLASTTFADYYDPASGVIVQ
jgi:hypothetical protein